jgi:ubiquinone/menaquinone biosynthesis C-methylase UbiE
MQAEQAFENLRVYNEPAVASHYASLEYLTLCERLLFDTYIKPGMAILDLGVGGGRTTSCLSQNASRYVGLDYSEEMIRMCRQKFPQLEFVVADASNLSAFNDASFDAIVMAFNAIDYVLPRKRCLQCLCECRRVLRSAGILIFSSHNPRAVLARPAWNRERLRAFALRLAGQRSVSFHLLLLLLTAAKALHSCGRSVATSIARIIRRVPTRAFWHGEGCFVDASHGGLMTHCWIPDRVVAELIQFGFRLATIRGDDYPRKSGLYVTDWYYYAFSKSDDSVSGESCT